MKPLHPLTFGESPCHQTLASAIKTKAQLRSCASFLCEANEILAAIQAMPNRKAATTILTVFRSERLDHIDTLLHLEGVRSLVKNATVAAFRNVGKKISS